MIKIVVFASDQTVENEIVISKDDFSIGRTDASDVRIPDRTISGKHVRVRIADQKLRITDLVSTNGTWIDGEAVSEREVAEGENIRLGSRAIAFFFERPHAEPADTGKTVRNPVRCRAAGIPVEFAVEDSPEQSADSSHLAFPLQTILLSQLPMIIGSGGHCPCQLKSGDVMPEHARLTRCGEQFEIMTIDGHNPVLVNGEPVEKKRLLKWGDVIAVGSYTFRVQPIDQASETVSSATVPTPPADPLRIAEPTPEKSRSWSHWISSLIQPSQRRRSA